MFYWDRGLFLAKGNLAIDSTRRQENGFISHAHGDHSARHQRSFCTPETAALCRLRLRGKHNFQELTYEKPFSWAGLQLTLYPAGHCLGSAMLHVQDEETGESLLYSGDFKLGPSSTSIPARPVSADSLIMECTFGEPLYCLPPRQTVIDQFLDEVRRTIAYNRTPVVFAYTLGKSQEITKILTDAGFPVRQHKDIYAISQIYESFGVSLGDVLPLTSRIAPSDRVLILPARGDFFETETEPTTFALTGWAQNRSAPYRLGVDFAFPLSDHADYNDLISLVEQVQPKTVYCTHGPDSFVDRLLDRGFNAKPVDRPFQGRLF
ncbi:MAG: MBL fold metallo-hydrolase RNA specificity domain-containing protein [Thermoguttaceae bacterium]